ncbi:MAG: VWA domain-containing protein [Thermoanaerobaculia bacterium]
MRLITSLLLVFVATQASAVEVWIDRPSGLEYVYGKVEILAIVVSEENVSGVEIWVDGDRLGELVEPPYNVTVDVGYDNTVHEFKAIARSAAGRTATARVVTPVLEVDEVVDIELQQLYVTVTQFDHRVLDLQRQDFRILDDGDRQDMVTFERGDVPLTAVLLLDCSLSMKGERLEAALDGARVFIDGMEELDEAMVMLFSDRLLRETGFSSNQSDLDGALSAVEATGGTAINDHLFTALAKLEARQGRRVVVLFSDGADVHSVLDMEEVLRKARLSQALIYWIYLPETGDENGVPSYTSAWRNIEGNKLQFRQLREAVQESGGRVHPLESLDQMEEAFAGILAELREQYVLGYYPTIAQGDGSWHEIKVRVKKSGLDVRTRGGYVDY